MKRIDMMLTLRLFAKPISLAMRRKPSFDEARRRRRDADEKQKRINQQDYASFVTEPTYDASHTPLLWGGDAGFEGDVADPRLVAAQANAANIADADLFAAVQRWGPTYSHLSAKRRSNADLARAALAAWEPNYGFVPEHLRALLLTDEAAEAKAKTKDYKYLPVEIRRRFAMQAVAAWGPNYQFVPLTIRNDPELAKLAVSVWKHNYAFSPLRVRQNHPELAAQAIAAWGPNYQFVPDSLRKTDLLLAQQAISAWEYNYLFVPEALQIEHPELAQQAVAVWPRNFRFVPHELQGLATEGVAAGERALVNRGPNAFPATRVP